MAHRPESYQRLGRLVASGKSMDRQEFQARYSSDFMGRHRDAAATGERATAHARLFHGHPRPVDRRELLTLIESHAAGQVPLVVPLTLFAHHIRRRGVPYLADQTYLEPHPVELMLRNHV